MSNISYITGDASLLDDIKELWEQLNEHHMFNSEHFADFYNCLSFESRKIYFLKKVQNGSLRVEIALDEVEQKRVGYCISSVDDEKAGEIESIYIDKGYRNNGIGAELMKKAIEWMDTIGVVKKAIAVAAGNEAAFGFYERFGFYPRKTILEQVSKSNNF